MNESTNPPVHVNAPFEVEFYFWFRAGNEAAIFRRSLQLPFAPYPGLRVHFGHPDEDDGDRVVSVVWLSAESRFVCHMEDDADDASQCSVRDAVAVWQARGWTVDLDSIR